jgi:hypothetical protein
MAHGLAVLRVGQLPLRSPDPSDCLHSSYPKPQKQHFLSPLFSISCALFCSRPFCNSFAISSFRTLCAKHRGWVYPPQSAPCFQGLTHSSKLDLERVYPRSAEIRPGQGIAPSSPAEGCVSLPFLHPRVFTSLLRSFVCSSRPAALPRTLCRGAADVLRFACAIARPSAMHVSAQRKFLPHFPHEGLPMREFLCGEDRPGRRAALRWRKRI